MTLTLGVTPCVGLPRTPKIALIDSKDGIRAVPFVTLISCDSLLSTLPSWFSFSVNRLVNFNGTLATALAGSRTCRSEEHTSELQSLMRISYAVFCLKKKTKQQQSHSIRSYIHISIHMTL